VFERTLGNGQFHAKKCGSDVGWTGGCPRRLGFIKPAIREGADLVPVFSFGENDIYEQMPNEKGTTFIYKIQEEISKCVWVPASVIPWTGGYSTVGFHCRQTDGSPS
jgi:hypothetical protein